MRYHLLAALAASLPCAAHGQQAPAEETATVALAAKAAAAEAAVKKEEASSGKRNFGGIDFGVGVSMSYDLGHNDRVAGADIVDGLVRVSRTENIRARIVLESHAFLTPTFSSRKRAEDEAYCAEFRPDIERYRNCRASLKDFGIGPFVALQPGGEKVIDAIGLGLMLGIRRRDVRSSSFNLGVGIFYDVDTQILGKGFVEDRPPPGNETEIRFRRQSQSGLLFISSYSF